MSKGYWRKRSEKIADKNIKDINQFERRIQEEYEKQIKYIDDEINSFIMKHADENGLSYVKAMKELTGSDLKNYNEEIEKFKNKFGKLDSDELQKKIAVLNNRKNVTRLQAMQDKIQIKLDEISVGQINNVEEFLGEQYINTYNETENMFGNYFDVKGAFETPSLDKIAPIIQYPYTGEMFSSRIWKANDKLVTNLTETLTKGLVQGKSIDKMSKELKNVMFESTGNRYSTYDVRRIIRTESRFIQERAMHDVNEKYGCKEYEIIASGNHNCCGDCEDRDGAIFYLEDRVEGVTAPPFHPNCCCSTAPHISDERLEELEQNFIDSFKEEPEAGHVEFNNVVMKIANLASDSDIPDGYLKEAMDKIAVSPSHTRELWNKYESVIDFESITSTKGDYFSPTSGKVVINLKNDSTGLLIKKHDTFFHEIGHLIDCKSVSGNDYSSTLTKDFSNKIKEEAKIYIDKICKREGAKGYKNRKMAVYNELTSYSDNASSSVSDLIGGSTTNRYGGGWGHSTSYWKSSETFLPKEAFAEFFSATINNNIDQLKLMKEVFPESYKMWTNIVKDMIK